MFEDFILIIKLTVMFKFLIDNYVSLVMYCSLLGIVHLQVFCGKYSELTVNNFSDTLIIKPYNVGRQFFFSGLNLLLYGCF